MVSHAVANVAGAAVRAVAFASTVPLMPKHAEPRIARVVLAVVLIPMLWMSSLPRSDPQDMLSALVADAIVGAALGLSAAVVASAVTAAGDTIDIALGSPPFAERAPTGGPIALLYQLAYATVFLQSGGLTIMISGLVHAGANLSESPLSFHGFVVLGAVSIRTSMILAGPPLFAQAIATIAAGILARAAPQLGGMFFSTSLSPALVLLATIVGGTVLWPELADVVREGVVLSRSVVQ